MSTINGWPHFRPVHNASFSRQLRNANISQPAGLTNPHGHHIVMKGAFSLWNDSARRSVRYAQAILQQHNIDIHGIGENVHWGPMSIAGNGIHTQRYAREVAMRLQLVRKGSRQNVLNMLQQIASELQSGTFPI
ncbi:AHH domain-containing protein [Lignipirellula cremea]|uniref:AHH domain-containing protein n=1 Tax=Lignipirellula cremea TaxID=2528010 RepID=UPI00119E0B2E